MAYKWRLLSGMILRVTLSPGMWMFSGSALHGLALQPGGGFGSGRCKSAGISESDIVGGPRHCSGYFFKKRYDSGQITTRVPLTLPLPLPLPLHYHYYFPYYSSCLYCTYAQIAPVFRLRRTTIPEATRVYKH